MINAHAYFQAILGQTTLLKRKHKMESWEEKKERVNEHFLCSERDTQLKQPLVQHPAFSSALLYYLEISEESNLQRITQQDQIILQLKRIEERKQEETKGKK